MNQPSKTNDKPRTRIDRIVSVSQIPPPDKRDPHTLYVPLNQDVALRNQHLGAFMDRWSGLERAMLDLLWRLLGSEFATAEVLFYSTTNIKTQTDMITGLVVLRHKQQAARWRKLSDECLRLSINRNHLVHGHWIPEARIDVYTDGRPMVTKLEWFRVYMTGDPDLNARAAMQSGKPKTGQHRFSLERILHKIEQIDALTKAIYAFTSKACGSTPPTI